MICCQNLLYQFRFGLLMTLLISFWLTIYLFSVKIFDPLVQRDVVDSDVNNDNFVMLGIVPQELLSINQIQRRIHEYNKLQTVLNEDIFGPLKNDSLVIVIQVHNRLLYLKHAVSSLAKAKYIGNALLIFSHDYYDEEINNFIQSIKFCKVLQIFYPYSIQTHPNRFPGDSKNDCPRNIGFKEAVKRKCINALHPDSYGHYREAKNTQMKHHWWWKANRVFNGLNLTKNYTGLVVFFEEDHYMVQDFIHILYLMDRTRQSFCSQCKILSLGPNLEYVSFTDDSKKADIMKWSNIMYNMGMTFNRSVWEELKSCAKMFCTYDDYNWDWTLQTVFNKCLPEELTAMVLNAPRVFHIGECGFHKKSKCEGIQLLKRVQKLLETSTAYLYPQNLHLTYVVSEKSLITNKGNGGWGDIRDHNLCLGIAERYR